MLQWIKSSWMILLDWPLISCSPTTTRRQSKVHARFRLSDGQLALGQEQPTTRPIRVEARAADLEHAMIPEVNARRPTTSRSQGWGATWFADGFDGCNSCQSWFYSGASVYSRPTRPSQRGDGNVARDAATQPNAARPHRELSETREG